MANGLAVVRSDAQTGAVRRVEGNRRVIYGTLAQPVAKYATGGFEVTHTLLGFDKQIDDLDVQPDSAFKAFVTVERVSGQKYVVKFWSAVATELANESEAMKEKLLSLRAEGI